MSFCSRAAVASNFKFQFPTCDIHPKDVVGQISYFPLSYTQLRSPEMNVSLYHTIDNDERPQHNNNTTSKFNHNPNIIIFVVLTTKTWTSS